MKKKWFTSKIVWVNVIALVAIIIQLFNEDIAKEIVGAESSLLALINIVLRLLTSTGLEK